ncbi:hypothetical protein [Spirosoma foliorum]|uniref:Uncharacterized protein n=1 Tax=Spirosoma foliorum TaxID=2710596 RepID=A0A7G5H5F9_9BACT|nr:hypothetical protein [Spirosoma foliorum]QMW06351.1 hypothetical protein H3H32_16405 [Spirosoma foliorum]
MATYRRFHKPAFDENGTPNLSMVNMSRVLSGNSTRPQIVEAVQWHTGEDTLGLSERWLEQLEDGDYIVIDAPEFPYVWKKEDFEANTEFIAD